MHDLVSSVSSGMLVIKSTAAQIDQRLCFCLLKVDCVWLSLIVY